MQKEFISFRETGYFSSFICDYLDEKQSLKPFFNHFPKIENFKRQIEEKEGSKELSEARRDVLVSVLKKQYRQIDTSEKTAYNIGSLISANTFTITTGHQLNLFTGPLYFLYKIISTINLAVALKEAYPNYQFVPVYWMATEDHDFEEINYFNFHGKRFRWNKNAKGAVGNLSTDGLDEVFNLFAKDIGQGKNADDIKELFELAYLKHNNLTDATRYLANALFKDYGLVIIDGADKALKKQFVPFMTEELMHQRAYTQVTQTNSKISELPDNYTIQVNPREINLFYLKDGLRERIVAENDTFKVVNTAISFSKEQLLNELSTHPERFSPNVIMRPLYQEVILPNLCYIGGGGELAYWLQLKEYFNEMNVIFPILLLRNSVLIQSKSQAKKLQNLGIPIHDVFLNRATFINKRVREISNIDINFSAQKAHLKAQFKALYELAENTDKSFLGAVKAQEVKQLNGLDNLEKRLLKAQKRKLSDEVSRMTELQNELFPNQGLQERNTNFSEFYLEYGADLIPELVKALNPLKNEFVILNI